MFVRKSLTMLRGSSGRASRRVLLLPTCREVPCCSTATEASTVPERMRWRDGREYAWPLDNLRMLKARQMIAHTYPQDLLTKKLTQQRYESAPTVYAGFDATGDSLHVGSLMIINSLLHLARLNWTVIFLIGDATARLGDPSGHTEDRLMLRREDVEANSESIVRQLRMIVDNYQNLFAHKALNVRIMRNSEWYDHMNVIDFLAQYCRSHRVGPMLKRQSTRERLNSTGLSFTEFAYPTLQVCGFFNSVVEELYRQAYDWLHLYREHQCIAQIGGVDQLANIDSGFHLIKRTVENFEPWGIMCPLLIDKSGGKFGKNAMEEQMQQFYLSERRTSPFVLYQALLNMTDEMARRAVYPLTHLTAYDVDRLLEEQTRSDAVPWTLQKNIAEHVTKLAHSDVGLQLALRCTQILYGKDSTLDDIVAMSDEEREVLMSGAHVKLIPIGKYNGECRLVDVVCDTGAAVNERDAAKMIRSGAFKVNDKRVYEPEIKMNIRDVLFAAPEQQWTLLRRGRRRVYFVKWI